MGPSRSAKARRVEVTEQIEALAAPEYASAFEVRSEGANAHSAEQWARATFELAPSALRWFVVVGWKYVLGFRLGPRRSAAHVLGWEIVTVTPDSIMLELQSALVDAHKVVRVEDSRVLATTFVRYKRRAGRAAWALAAPIHHRTEPYLLGHAVTQLKHIS